MHTGFYAQSSGGGGGGNFAPIDSPVFTGTPKAPTQEMSSDSKNIATIGNLQDFAPKESPVFTGEPKAPIQDLNSDSNNIATIGNLQDFAPKEKIFFSVSDFRGLEIKPNNDSIQQLAFNEIIAQNSNDFDGDTGIYNVPENGLYKFSYYLFLNVESFTADTSVYPRMSYCKLTDESTNIVREYKCFIDKTQYYNLSVSAIVPLEKDDKIFLGYNPNGAKVSGKFMGDGLFWYGELIKKS